MAVRDRLKSIIINEMGVPEQEVQDNSTFADLGADGLDRTQLLMRVEEEFGLEIPDDAAANLNSVQDVEEYVLKNAGDES